MAKDRIKNIVFSNNGNRRYFTVDGETYSVTEFADHLGIAVTTLRMTLGRIFNDEELKLYIRKKFWATAHGYSGNTKIFYFNDFFVTSSQIAAMAGISSAAALERGKKFEEGLLSRKDLLKKSASFYKERSLNRGCWQGLSDKRTAEQARRLARMR